MRTQTEQNERTLEEVAPGERGVILQVGNENGPVKRRLVDMGLTPGTEVTVRKVAPFGDPVELNLRGYELSLRKADAAQIRVATGAEGERRARLRQPRHTGDEAGPGGQPQLRQDHPVQRPHRLQPVCGQLARGDRGEKGGHRPPRRPGADGGGSAGDLLPVPPTPWKRSWPGTSSFARDRTPF